MVVHLDRLCYNLVKVLGDLNSFTSLQVERGE